MIDVQMMGRVAVVTLRSEPLNLLLPSDLTEIASCFTDFASDASVGAVLLTGAGKAFSAGARLGEEQSRETPPLDGVEAARLGQEMTKAVLATPVPVVAAIRGYCLGGGLELAMACDIRIAGDSARLGYPEVKWGFAPGWGGLQLLPQVVGRAEALRLILTAEQIAADEALRIGLVQQIVPDEDLQAVALDLASDLASRSRSAVRAIKDRLGMYVFEGLDEALDKDAIAVASLIDSDESRRLIEGRRRTKSPGDSDEGGR